MNANFARNKTTLAQCLGISRTLLYAYFKLPGSPMPRHDGRWSVSAFRKFIASHSNKVKMPNETEALKIRCLKIKAEREQHDLDVARGELRAAIERENLTLFRRAFGLLVAQFRRLPDELAPRFEGMSAREIHKKLTERQRQVFAQTAALLREESKEGAENVIPFQEKAVAA